MVNKNRSQKLLNYKINEAFVQLNFLDGFTYIDKAGEIVNGFVRENNAIPKFRMNLDGLVIENINEIVTELKITPSHIWIHFVEPKNLGNITDDAALIISRINKIIKPKILTRLGWRNYFIREDVDPVNPANKLKVSKKLGDFQLQNLILNKYFDEITSRVEVSTLSHEEDESKKVLLFDVDLGLNKPGPDIKVSLVKLRDTFKSNTFQDSIEELFNNV